MGTRRGLVGEQLVLCECAGAVVADDDDLSPWEPRKCLHCQRQAPQGKWRCEECQRVHGAEPDQVMSTLRANRRLESRAAQQ